MKITLVFSMACSIPKKNKKSRESKSKRSSRRSPSPLPPSPTSEDIVEGMEKIVCHTAPVFFSLSYAFTEQQKFQLDCKYYKDVAELYTDNKDVIIKTEIREELVWISFVVEHYLYLTLEEYETLIQSEIKISVVNGTKMVSPRVLEGIVEEPTYYIPAHIRNKEYTVAYRSPLDRRPSSEIVVEDFLDSILDKITVIEENGYLSRLQLLDDVKDRKILRSYRDNIIDKNFRIESPEIEYHIPSFDITAKSQRLKKLRPPKVSAGGNFTFIMKGSELFLKEFIKYEAVSSRRHPMVYCGIGGYVDDVLPNIIQYEMNPLIVKLDALNNLPIDELEAEGVNIVYATYEIPGYPRVVTNGHRLDESIQFNDKRVFPTNKLHHSIFAEFIQTKTLDIEILGIRETVGLWDETDPFCGLFGDYVLDSKLGKPLKVYEAREIIAKMETRANHVEICVVRIPLDSLSKGKTHIYTACHITSQFPIIWDQSQRETRRNLRLRPVKQGDILINNTELCFTVAIYESVRCAHTADLTDLQLYDRLLLIYPVDEEESKFVSLTNLGKPEQTGSEIILDSVARIHHHNKSEDDLKTNGISGFFLKGDKNFVLFMEGRKCSLEPYYFEYKELLDRTQEVKHKMFYNKKLVFTTRLYVDEDEDFIDRPEIFFSIRSEMFIADLMQCGRTYTAKEGCQIVLRILDNLVRVNSIEEACQNNLFPSLKLFRSIYKCDSICHISKWQSCELEMMEESFEKFQPTPESSNFTDQSILTFSRQSTSTSSGHSTITISDDCFRVRVKQIKDVN